MITLLFNICAIWRLLLPLMTTPHLRTYARKAIESGEHLILNCAFLRGIVHGLRATVHGS